MTSIRFGARVWRTTHMKMSSASKYFASSDWDLKALNDEMEGLIGKFEPSADSVVATHPSTVPLTQISKKKNFVNEFSSDIKVSAAGKLSNTKTKHTQSLNTHGFFSCTVFYFDSDRSPSLLDSDQENLSYKNWQDFSLDDLVEELANHSAGGIIIFNPSNELISPAQRNLLKIYKKSSSVVLVTLCSGPDSKTSTTIDDTSFASSIIQGFGYRDGIAAAVAGIRSGLRRP